MELGGLVADPLGVPVGLLQEAGFEPGDVADGVGLTVLIEDGDAPEVAPAGLELGTGVGDTQGVRGLEATAIPEVGPGGG